MVSLCLYSKFGKACIVQNIKMPGQSNFDPAWSWRSDLNRRPADYESAALPTEPLQQIGFRKNRKSTRNIIRKKAGFVNCFFELLCKKLIFSFLHFSGQCSPRKAHSGRSSACSNFDIWAFWNHKQPGRAALADGKNRWILQEGGLPAGRFPP